MLQQQDARILQYRQEEDREQRTIGKQGAACTSASKANKPAVVQPLQGLVQTSSETKDLNELAEKGQRERFGGESQADKPLSKAEKARLEQELAHKRKAKANVVTKQMRLLLLSSLLASIHFQID